MLSLRLNWTRLATASNDLCRALLALYAETWMQGRRPPPETYDGIRALQVLMPQYFLAEDAETPEGVIPLSLLQLLSEFICQSYVNRERGDFFSPDEGRHLHLDRIFNETEDDILPCTTNDILGWYPELDSDVGCSGNPDGLPVNSQERILYQLPRALAPQLAGKRALQPLVVTHLGVEYLVVALKVPEVGAIITQEDLDKTDEISLLPLKFVDIAK